jgi:hypothetical protein
MDIKGIECESMDWTHLVEDMFYWEAFANKVMNLQVP